MIVRLALETDEKAFVELSRMACAEGADFIPFSEEKVEKTFFKYLDSANPTIFVAEENRKVVGFLLATMSDYRFADGFYTTQEVLFVSPDHRGSQAAALLIQELVRWSEMLGAAEITGGNDNALFTKQMTRLLEREGFELAGVFMRRILKETP